MRTLAAAWLAPASLAAAAATSPGLPEFSMEAMAGATNQAATGTGTGDVGNHQPDLPLMLLPRLRIERSGGFALHVDAALALNGSALGRSPLRARPDIDIDLRATLVDRLLSVDGAARLRQAEINPFGPRADLSSIDNQRTEQSYRAGPVLRTEPWPGVLLLARQSNSLTLDNAGTQNDLVGSDSTLTLARPPQPLGAAFSLSRLASRLRGLPSSQIALETARLSVSGVLAPDVEIGLDGGADRTHTPGFSHSDPLWALRAAWRPSERTALTTLVERRFFGNGFELALHERTPWMSLVVTASRRPVLVSQSGGDDGTGLLAALDAILTTRFPDPAARGTLVDRLVNTLGLDARGYDPIGTQAPYPQVQTHGEISWTMLSARESLTLDVYERSYRVLQHDGNPLAAAGTATDDYRQRGLSLQASRSLTPTLSVDASWRIARIAGLGTDDGRRSTDALERVWFTHRLSPHASLQFGAQARQVRSTQAEENLGKSVLLFVGFAERF